MSMPPNVGTAHSQTVVANTRKQLANQKISIAHIQLFAEGRKYSHPRLFRNASKI